VDLGELSPWSLRWATMPDRKKKACVLVEKKVREAG
jgi:hypothetical protein